VAASRILIDTGPLVALLSERDQHHAICVEAARFLRGSFCTSWPVVTEATYLLRDRPNVVQTLLRRVHAGRIVLLPLGPVDFPGIADILARYSDQGFDLADASLMYLAEREAIETVFTTDRRHFSIYRSPAGAPLTIVPFQ